MDQILQLLAEYGLFLIPCMMIAGAFGAPFPEDLLTVATGYLIYKGSFAPTVALPVLLVSIVIADVIMYVIGSKIGARGMSATQIAKLQGWFRQYGSMVVFGARFVFGARGPTFLASGALGIPFRKFIVADLVAGAIFVPGLTYLAYRQGDNIDSLLAVIEQAGSIVGVAVVGLIVVGIVNFIIQRKRATLEP